MEPLRMTPHFRNHPSQEVCLVALGTVTKVIAVTVRPSLRVWFSHTLKVINIINMYVLRVKNFDYHCSF